MSIEGGMTSLGSDLNVKVQFRGPEFYKENRTLNKNILACLESLDLPFLIIILFITFTLRFDV